MAIGKLQEILKQLDAINPEELKQSMKGDSSPELAECLQSARQKLEKYLDIITKAIEGDYRTAPRLPDCTQKAIVPVEQPTLAVSGQDELATEHDAWEKLKILEEIKCDEYKQLLKEKFGRISAASMKLLRKMDKIFMGLESRKHKMSDFGSELPCYTQPSMLKIIELLVDNIQDPQAERIKPYIRYLLRKFSFINSLFISEHRKFEALANKMEFLEFMVVLFGDNDSNIFDLQCRGTDWPTAGFGAVKCPFPLFLAGTCNYWQEDMDLADETKKHRINKIMMMLPKFQGMQKWLETALSGQERRKQLLTLMMPMTSNELAKLEPDSCQRFFAFLENADAVKRFESCSQNEQVDFILAGEYTFSALGNVLSRSRSSTTPP